MGPGYLPPTDMRPRYLPPDMGPGYRSPPDMRPVYLPPLPGYGPWVPTSPPSYWHLMVITGDLFKLVHLRIEDPTPQYWHLVVATETCMVAKLAVLENAVLFDNISGNLFQFIAVEKHCCSIRIVCFNVLSTKWLDTSLNLQVIVIWHFFFTISDLSWLVSEHAEIHLHVPSLI